MAQLAIAAAGAAVGSIFGPLGTSIGWALGSVVGSQFGGGQDTQGPRLQDLKVVSGAYGDVIPWVAGHPRVAGQIWWASDRREISETTSAGKGGGPTVTTYTYEVDLLIGLTDTVIVDVSRVWLNGKLVYVTLSNADVDSIANSVANPNWERMTVYTGEAGQLPDPTYDAAVGNAPAYRGRGSVFIEGLKLGNSGVIPNLTFEIATANAPPNSNIILNTGPFDQGLTDVSCSPLGDATIPINPLGATSLSSSITFLQDQPGGSDLKGFGWLDAALNPSGVNRTYEVLFQIGASTKLVGNSEPTFIGFLIGRSFTSSNAEITLYLDPWNSRAFVRREFLGDSPWVGGASRGSKLHFAVVVPATVNAGNPIRYYLNGVQFWTTTSALSGLAQAVMFGGNCGIAPANTVHDMTCYGMRVTDGLVYPGGTSFTPPVEFQPPICATSTDLQNLTLQEVVESLCERSDMPPSMRDASALSSITKPVRAISVGQVASARAVLEQLRSAYFFDSYATDKLYFVPRAGSVADTINADDMAAAVDVAEAEILGMQIGSNAEIAAQVAVTYANVDADYNTATEQSDRLLTGQVNTSSVELAIALTSAEAKGIADAMVTDGYASRVTGTFSVPVGYADLMPTDVVTVPDGEGNTYRVRIVRRTDDGSNLIRFEWALDDATAVESAGITSADYTPTISVALPGATSMQLLDVPLLRDADDYLGHYVAATSSSTSWPGASIQRSLDDVEYAEAAVVVERAVMGSATTALGNWAGGHVFDETNTVTVDVGYGTLSSSTRTAMLDDTSINAMAVGDEVIRFRTATLLDVGRYLLSGLLRGQKGTEWAMGTHVIGDSVVLLQSNGLRYVSIDLPSVDSVRYYRGVTRGRALSTATSEPFTCNAASLRPLYPVDIRSTVNAANEIVLTWNRRTRYAFAFLATTGVPLGEASEAYEVDVVLVSSGAVLRTISAGSATATYTAAQQTADGVSGSSAIRFDVYQISGTVGRGRAGSLSTVGAVTPRAQITRITVGGTFASGAALYATLGGVTYNYTSVGGDTNLSGIASSFAAVIDAAAAYSAAAAGANIDVTGAVSAIFPAVVGVSAGDNTTTWALTQTASATVSGVSNKLTATWLNLADPAGSNAYPLGTTFALIVQRTSPALNLIYTYDSTPSGRTDYNVRPIVASQIASAVAASGDAAAYGFSVQVDPSELWTLNIYTPAAEPYNWTVQAVASLANISGLVGNAGSGVTPATLRPQIVTLTLAGTPATGRVYRATLEGVNFDYTATGGDTTMALVATGLAAVIDADASYIASAVGGVITITHASNNVPFTYAASIIASTVTLSAVNIQEAA